MQSPIVILLLVTLISVRIFALYRILKIFRDDDRVGAVDDASSHSVRDHSYKLRNKPISAISTHAASDSQGADAVAGATSAAMPGRQGYADRLSTLLTAIDHPFSSRQAPQLEVPTEHRTCAKLATTCRGTRGDRRPPNPILFLAVNSGSARRPGLDQELAAIERELSMTANRADFGLISRWDLCVDEMARHLMIQQPAIIHLSDARGPSLPERSRRTTVQDAGDGRAGILVKGDRGEAHLVPPRGLAMMIDSAAPSVRVAVLSGCYSEVLAEALCAAVECVVGTTNAIRDDAARWAAAAFYRALGNGRSVGQGILHAKAVLVAKQVPGERDVCCRSRAGVDAHQIVLAMPWGSGG
jgi:hypothetical protein